MVAEVCQPFSITISTSGGGGGGDSVLELAFAALASGASDDFVAGAETVFNNADYAWQTIWHHDEARGLIHGLGKPASQNNQWKHRYYTLATGLWTTVGLAMFDNSGHVYGNSALDTATGDLYLATNNTLRRWRAAVGWEELVASITSGGSHKNGIALHPNLFGIGQKGLVIQGPTTTRFYNIATGVITVQNVTLDTGANAGSGLYVPFLDKTFTGYQNQILTSGGPTLQQVASSPIWTRGYTSLSTDAFGAALLHPLNPNKVLLLERNSAASTARRLYESTDCINWSQIGTHPFTTTSVFCSVPDNGIWALGNSGSGAGSAYSHIWKPPV